MNKKVCIYCASSNKVAPIYFNAAEQVTELIVSNGYGIVYGGGSLGLMGRVADTALQHNGHVLGIMPKFMTEVEWNHTRLTELILVEDMSERKKQLMQHADAVVALAGGCGTLEELAEVVSLKRLGLFTKPIIILNTNGFYNHLQEFFEHMIAENFMSENHRPIWTFVNTPDEVIPAINSSTPWSADAIRFASV